MSKWQRIVFINVVPLLLGFCASGWYNAHIAFKQSMQELKDAKSEIELIGNFCADSIPPRVLENGRSK